MCPLFGRAVETNLETAGLPCTDQSRAGNQLYEQGPTAVVFIAHAKRHIQKRTPFIIIENVQELRIGIIRMLYGAHYDIVVLYVGTEDQGHDGGTRYRLYALLNHRERVIAVYDAKEMYARITSVIRQHVRTQPCDYLVSTEEEIMLDAGETARTFATCSQSVRRLASHKPVAFKFRFRRDPNKDKNLFLYLGDNVSNRLTWSAVSKRIPTLRMSGGKTWHVMSRRWLTGREKLASLGFPVTASAADSMGVPELPVRDTKRASAISGNCMHFSTVAVVQFVALVCYKQTQ
ncbi:unnamed protein product [Polarella glacialis]|uniref:DNA (cytosine-5-)-methyltransferase n=1 Tax=Polarella glacialis TaxID=89957 RepID=A0A813EMT1_POLGL|nr:unnamed protein product [Polarella glacialis]